MNDERLDQEIRAFYAAERRPSRRPPWRWRGPAVAVALGIGALAAAFGGLGGSSGTGSAPAPTPAAATRPDPAPAPTTPIADPPAEDPFPDDLSVLPGVPEAPDALPTPFTVRLVTDFGSPWVDIAPRGAPPPTATAAVYGLRPALNACSRRAGVVEVAFRVRDGAAGPVDLAGTTAHPELIRCTVDAIAGAAFDDEVAADVAYTVGFGQAVDGVPPPAIVRIIGADGISAADLATLSGLVQRGGDRCAVPGATLDLAVSTGAGKLLTRQTAPEAAACVSKTLAYQGRWLPDVTGALRLEWVAPWHPPGEANDPLLRAEWLRDALDRPAPAPAAAPIGGLIGREQVAIAPRGDPPASVTFTMHQLRRSLSRCTARRRGAPAKGARGIVEVAFTVADGRAAPITTVGSTAPPALTRCAVEVIAVSDFDPRERADAAYTLAFDFGPTPPPAIVRFARTAGLDATATAALAGPVADLHACARPGTALDLRWSVHDHALQSQPTDTPAAACVARQLAASGVDLPDLDASVRLEWVAPWKPAAEDDPLFEAAPTDPVATIPAAVVDAVIAAHADAPDDCARAARVVPAGVVLLSWDVVDGSPIATTLVRDTTRAPRFAACLREAASHWVFPDGTDGIATHTFRFPGPPARP